jgi:ferredoxin-NADP reductase
MIQSRYEIDFNKNTMNYSVKILKKVWLTHNVVQFVLERPKEFQCAPGDAVDIILDTGGTNQRSAPFTLTNMPDSAVLELIIKVYPNLKGFTHTISQRKVGDTLSITSAWKSFEYLGKGTFIAAGSGITPFIPMIKISEEQGTLLGHKLIYANRKLKDVILKKELEEKLGSHFYNILSEEQVEGYGYGRIDRKYLDSRIVEPDQYFYVCGPDDFSTSIKGILMNLGVKAHNIQIGY